MELNLGMTLATATAGTILWFRILVVKQAVRFAALTVYLAQHVFWGWVLALLPRNTRGYVLLYEVSNPVEWIAATWCVAHLLGKAFDGYPGIKSVSRWATWGASAVAISVALALANYFWQGGVLGQKTLFYFEVADRSVLLGLALVVILTMFFLSRYPLRLQANTWTSLIAFSAIILSLAGARLVDSLAPVMAVVTVDIIQLVLEFACCLAWAWAFRREEEQAPARVIFSHSGGHMGEAELLRQLEAMNGILHRVGRG